METKNITKVEALEILDSRGNPTIQATVWAGEVSATAAVPSGASTGVHEALELRDGDKNRYGGNGVLKAVKNINIKIAKIVVGMDVNDQENIDREMIKLDKTPNKAKLGANAMLAVSLATARLAAKMAHLPLFSSLAIKYGYVPKYLPVPLFNVINGGRHADSGLDIQEFFIIPQKGKFSERLRMGAEVYHALKKNLEKQNLTTSVGDEGGFAPHLKSNEDALKQLELAVKSAGYSLGKDFAFGLDAASSEFFDVKKSSYEMKASGKSLKSASMYQFYQKWLAKYPIAIIEDGCSEDDFLGWKMLTQQLGNKIILVGDDLFVTNPKRIQMGITQKIANALLVKPNQIGTLTETVEAIKLAQSAGYKIILSHRSGETCDSFIADLAVAVGADFIKSGAPCRSERLAKYNRLLEIEEEI